MEGLRKENGQIPIKVPGYHCQAGWAIVAREIDSRTSQERTSTWRAHVPIRHLEHWPGPDDHRRVTLPSQVGRDREGPLLWITSSQSHRTAVVLTSRSTLCKSQPQGATSQEAEVSHSEGESKRNKGKWIKQGPRTSSGNQTYWLLPRRKAW